MIILASKSPRRKALLNKIFSKFLIVPANIDENKFPICDLSLIKAQTISQQFPKDTIIAADTFVEFNNRIFNKPKSKFEAYTMLKELSNNTHKVTTYYTILNKELNISLTKSVITLVTFNSLSDSLINEYIESGSPLDKAGAYGIQDNDEYPIIKEFIGDLDNVIGLPVNNLRNDLLELGITTDIK